MGGRGGTENIIEQENNFSNRRNIKQKTLKCFREFSSFPTKMALTFKMLPKGITEMLWPGWPLVTESSRPQASCPPHRALKMGAQAVMCLQEICPAHPLYNESKSRPNTGSGVEIYF